MKFKEYKVEPESSWFKRIIQSQHIRKTIFYMFLGAMLGFLFLYIVDGRHQDTMEMGEILKNMGIGALFGLFITNSPCARNKC